MAASTLSVCSSDLSYGSRVCQPGAWDSCPESSWQVDDGPESCCEPPCCAPSCCAPAPCLSLICTPANSDFDLKSLEP
nr:PREDICTED: keratin-associated protein 10-7-like [Equus przewalskii]